MYQADRLWLTDLTTEHLPAPLGLDTAQPRFGWKLHSGRKNTPQAAYCLTVNGSRPDSRELAPENTAYHKLLQYQTYDVTALLQNGDNALGVALADGWWAGREISWPMRPPCASTVRRDSHDRAIPTSLRHFPAG